MATVLCPRLVGRAAEQRELAELVAAAAGGRGAVLTLRGDAGMGKSRLAREAVDLARAQGVLAAVGRCAESAPAPPLRPLTEAVTRLLRDRTVPDVPPLRPYRRLLARLAPDLLPDGQPDGADPDPVHLGEGVLRLLRLLGSGGALLVVEDVHHADPLTTAVLEHLADELAAGAEPVSLLLTARPEPGRGLDLVDALTARRSASTTVLPPLDAAATRRLVLACPGGLAPEAVDVVVDRCAGVPFLAEELVASALDAPDGPGAAGLSTLVPLSLADAVRRRVAGLPAGTAALLALAAVAGRRAEPALLAAATGAEPHEVVTQLAPARAVSLLDPGEPCAFRHALTRDAVLAGMLPTEQAGLARRLLAAALDTGAEPSVVAALADSAGDAAAGARAWLQIGGDAVARGFPRGADDPLARAERLARAAGEQDLATAAALQRVAGLALAGRPTDVLALADRLGGGDAPALTPTDRRALHLHAARAALDAGLLARAEQELAALPELEDHTALGALVALADGRLAEAEARARRVLDSRDAPPSAVCEAWEVLGRLLRGTDLPAAERAFSAARTTAREAGLALWEVRALHELGTVDMFLAGVPGRLLEAHTAATSLGALSTVAVLDVQISGCLSLLLDPEGGLAHAGAGATAAERTGARPIAAAAAFSRALAHACAGRTDEADAAAARAAELSGDDPETLAMLAGLVEGLGGLLVEDRARARQGFASLACHVRDAPRMPPTPGQALRALLATVDGSPEAADARAEVAASGVTTVPFNALLLGYAEAVALGRHGSAAEADARWAAAEAALPPGPPRGVVLVLRDLGRRLAAERALVDGWGDPLTWARSSLVTFDTTAPPVAEACRALLRGAGAPAPRRTAEPSVPPAARAAGITTREHDVLVLVAGGATNRQVAERLHLSERTVETHVARLLRKTGVARRWQLRDWLA